MKTRYTATIYGTPKEAVIASAVDFLTAMGNNDLDEALEFWEEGPKQNRDESYCCKEHGYWPHSDKWENVWDEVGERLKQRKVNQ